MSKDAGGPGDSFEDRLQAARTKQGLDTPPKPSGDPAGAGPTPWGIGMRVGVEMVSALVVAIAIGYGLDRFFGTKPFLLLLFVPLGVAAGVTNVWRLFAPRQDGTKRGR